MRRFAPARNASRGRACKTRLPAPSRLAVALRHALLLGGAFGAGIAQAEVPVPCGGGSCATLGGPASWVTVGQATMAQVGQTQLDITQSSDFAEYNWQSFNISADARVNFQLPQRTSVALNRIFQANPSQIFGALTSNGTVYLLNANGVLFGETARVNVGSLIASSLNVAVEDVQAGLAAAAAAGRPAFERFATAHGDIDVERGAVITAADGGQVFLFAANVNNQGAILAPDGQVILGAGDRIYLSRPEDTTLRGFLVEVENSEVATGDLNAFLNGGPAPAKGSVANEGSITAAGGNVSLAGLAVNQSGRINVTRAVNDGGTIRLVAGDVTTTPSGTDANGRTLRTKTGERLGRLDISAAGCGSGFSPTCAPTEVLANVDEGSGGRVYLRAGETVISAAAGGRVDIAGEDVKLLSPSIEVSGSGSVNVTGNRLLVSTLDLAPEADPDTLLISSSATTAPANFRAFAPNGQSLPSQALVLPGNLTLTAVPGADAEQIDGGRIFVFAPSITSRASLTANEGQVLLAAGEQVFLGRPTDPDLRGYTATVRSSAAVTQTALDAVVNGTVDRLVSGVVEHLGSITAREGAIVMVGPQIIQGGSLTTSTSTAVNGGIYLFARDIASGDTATRSANTVTLDGLSVVNVEGSGSAAGDISQFAPTPRRNGALTFAAGSRTEVALEQNGTLAIDAQQQLASVVRGTGRSIVMEAGSRIVAPAGDVSLFATQTPLANGAPNLSSTTSDAFIKLDPGALIDVSGVDAVVEESQYIVEVKLFSDQLKDSPVQRDGVLFSETVRVDLRNTGLRADGTRWYGTPLADLSNNIGSQPRDINEISSVGGYVSLVSDGSVVVSEGATVDVSGGTVTYPAATRPTSRVIKDGISFDIAEAAPMVRYDMVYDPLEPPGFQRDFGERWGIVLNYGFSPLISGLNRASTSPGFQRDFGERWGIVLNYGFSPLISGLNRASTSPASFRGSDAGAVELVAARSVFDGTLEARTTRGSLQRNASDRSIDAAAARRALLGVAPLGPEAVDAAIENYLGAVAKAADRRSSDELARGGRLIVGRPIQQGSLIQFRDTFVNDVIVADGNLGSLVAADGRAVGQITTASANAALPSLADSSASFDGSTRYSVLDSDLFGAGGALDVTLYANDQVVLAAPEALDLDNGGFEAVASRIDIASGIRGAGARVALHAVPTFTAQQNVSPSVTLREGVTLDVSGRFVNDALDVQAGRGLAPALIDGGSIDITASSEDAYSNASNSSNRGGLIDVRSGARLLAEGGARVAADSTSLDLGRGGDVSLVAEAVGSGAYLPGQVPLALAGTISGRAFGEGGTLHLGAPSICIGAACTDPAAMAAADASLQPIVAALGGNGFSFLLDVAGQPIPEGFLHYEFESTGGSLVVAPGEDLTLIAGNYVPTAALTTAATGSSAASVGRFTTLPLAQRAPSEVSLAMHLPTRGLIGDATTGHTVANVRDYALVIGAGATVASDIGGRVALSADSRILVNGTVSAPAGSITAEVSSADTIFGGLSNQGIWLGSSARLLATGAVRRRFDVTDSAYSAAELQTLRLGEVLDGGSVSLVAQAGLVATEAGSLIDVSAVAAPLGITQPNGLRRSQLVYGDAGSIRLEAAEAVLPDGSLRAFDAGVAGSRGGSLTVRLDANARNANEGDEITPTQRAQLDVAERVIDVVDGATGSFVGALTAGAALAAGDRGQAFIAADDIRSGGFDFLTLSARNNYANRDDSPSGPLPAAAGVVRFSDSNDGPFSLALDGAIRVKATVVENAGSDVSLAAPYIEIGYSDEATTLNRDYLAQLDPAAGTGSLIASASFLDVIGNLVISGFGDTTLRSSRDLRFLGTRSREPGQLVVDDRSLDSQMRVNGQLTLAAAGAYPTTLTDYTITVEGAGSRLVTEQTGSRNAVLPLSIGGRLSLQADDISHGGTLLAPLGTLEMNATARLDLLGGSTTSISPAGLVLPFGRTEFLQDWVYQINDRGGTPVNLVFDGSGDLGDFPVGGISLEGATVNAAPGALIDISAVREAGSVPTMAGAPVYTDPQTGRTVVGGDVYAWEFFGGLGGSTDILNEAANPGAFAVVPGFVSGFAPYDPEIAFASAVAFGKTITLSGGAGLPAGTYTVLPARYALLPGAYLVEPVAGTQDYVGTSARLTDGSVIAQGTFGTAGTGFVDSRTQGFRISPRATVDERAEYRIASANGFFTSNNRTTDDANPRPIDAGRLSLAASTGLSLDGTLASAAAPGGFGALVDIARTGGGSIAVVGEGGTASGPGALVLTDAQLNALGASSLLIGGSRSNTANGVTIATTASSVTLEDGAALAGGDLILTATGLVRLDDGTSLEGTGGQADARRYSTAGNGALARVSGQRTTSVTRTGSVNTTSGDFIAAEGSSIAASGAIQVGGTRTTTLDGDLALSAGLLTLEASRFNLGETEGLTGLQGLTLDNATLAAITADALALISATTIDLYGNAALSAGDITLDASALRAQGAAPVNAVLSGGRLTLTRSAAAVAAVATGGDGSLRASFDRIDLGPGSVDLAGFGDASLTATTQIRLAGDGALNLREGNLEAQAGHYSTDAGVSYALNVATGGSASLLATAALPASEPVSGLGGRLDVVADAVTLGGRFHLPTGALAATARTGDVNVIDGAELDVAGRAVMFVSQFAGGDGGVVKLQADAGQVALASGARVDLSADTRSRDAEAGSLHLLAPQGTVDLQATVLGEGAGGSLVVDAKNGDARQFVTAALGQAFADGLTETFWLRLREGSWDATTLAAGETLTAQSISIALDGQEGSAGGHFTLAGTLDASGAKGGDVTLDARRSLTLLDGASVLARGTGTPVADSIAGAASVAARGGEGGTVKLRVSGVTSGETVTDAGRLVLDAGSVVDVSALNGGNAGSIELRAHRDAVLTAGSADERVRLDGTLTGGSTQLQAFRVYSDEGTLTAADVNSSTSVGSCGSSRFCTDSASFMASAGALKNALGFGGSAAFDLLPEVEIRSNASLLLNADWSLHTWRFADPDNATRWLPGVLTLRAVGNLDIGTWNPAAGDTVAGTGTAAGRLSDGFTSATASADANFLGEGVLVNGRDASESWSYRLNAGADYAAASPLAVRPVASLASDANGLIGSVRVQKGQVSTVLNASNQTNPAAPTANPVTRAVRTGTGSIDVAAAGDIQLGNGASAIYTAGRAAPSLLLTPLLPGSNNTRLPRYPTGGGELALSAGRDIVQGTGSGGAGPVRTSVGDFMIRTGADEDAANFDRPVAWTVDFARFQHGVGALGGGDVLVQAGRDVNSLSVSLPSIGQQTGVSAGWDGSVVEVKGGGDLEVSAGRDILAGQYYVGLGTGRLEAGSMIRSDRTAVVSPDVNNPIDTLLVVDAGSFEIDARSDIAIEGVLNSTVLPAFRAPTNVQPFAFTRRDTAYFTYGASAGVSALSAGGEVSLRPDVEQLDAEFDSSLNFVNSDTRGVYGTLAPILTLVSLSGDVSVDRAVTYPSPESSITLLAGRSVFLAATPDGVNVSLRQSDADPLGVASIAMPGVLLAGSTDNSITTALETRTGLHDPTTRGEDFRPNRVVALSGTLGPRAGEESQFRLDFARPTEIFAASDINSLSLSVQHFLATDVSRVVSGGSIFYPVPRDAVGGINLNGLVNTGIFVHGPGALEVVAGKDIDLGVADGIDSVGNRERSFLPDGGADLYLLAGLNGQETGYGDFLGWVADSYQALRASSLIALDPVTRSPVTLPAGASFRIENRSDAAEGEFGDPATLVLLDAAGNVTSTRPVLVLTDPVDLSTVFPGASSDAEVAAAIRSLLEATDSDAERLALGTRVLFSLSATLGGNQSPLENAIREGINAIRLDVAAPPQHPIALFYEAVARFFPASGDRNLLRPLLEFALGITTIDDTDSIGQRLAEAGGSLSSLAASNLVAENADRAPSGEDDGEALSAADAAAEAEATSRVLAVRQASIGASVERLRSGSSLAGGAGSLESLLVSSNPVADAAIEAIGNDSLATVASLYGSLLEGQSALGASGYEGDISLNFSRVNTLDGGDIFLMTPGGSIDVGGSQTGFNKRAVELGLVARDGGSVGFLASGETNVNLSRIFATPNRRTDRAESITGISTTGDIDAGRGSQTAVSAPDPAFTFDAYGTPRYVLGQPLSGSGIRSFDRGARDVFVTPVGVLDTNEAGIFSEGEVVPPPIVVGAAGISAGNTGGGGGGAIAAPAAPDVAAAAVNDATSRATSAGQESVAENSQSGQQTAALGILRVEVLSFFGEGASEEGEEL